jgi:hypothetical protein
MTFGHSPPAPLPLRQDKNKICSLQESGLAKARQKEKHTSSNTAYPVTVFCKSLHPCLLLRSLPRRIAELRQTSDIPKHYMQFKKYFSNGE